MSLIEHLRKARIFSGLSENELARIAKLCEQRVYNQGDTVLSEGESSRELFIIGTGTVQVSLSTASESSTPLINLGEGQVFGEMALLDQGARSATIKALSNDTALSVIAHDTFMNLCEADNHIGFIVMRNLAAEMSFKLRYRNIVEQMDNQ
jgi:CRP/FNR family transcriptional regulator, cyclic AMP receptor protein